MVAIQKPLELWTEADLTDLIAHQVKEGYLLDYKEDFPTRAETLPKIIASFANTHGGLLLLGVSADKVQNVATSLPGLSRTKGLKERVMASAWAHLRPLPFFRSEIIELASGRCVLGVEVPESVETPHYLRGRIYVRNAESSDPVPLEDRYQIERLYARRRQAQAATDALFARHAFHRTFPEESVYWSVILACPTVPAEQRIPIFREDVWKMLKDVLHRMTGAEIHPRSTQGTFWYLLDGTEQEPIRYARVEENGFIEVTVKDCDASRGIRGDEFLYGRVRHALTALADIYGHETVQYLGELRLELHLHGIDGLSLQFPVQRGPYMLPEPLPTKSLHRTLSIRRTITVHELRHDISPIMSSVEQELRRAFGSPTLDPAPGAPVSSVS